MVQRRSIWAPLAVVAGLAGGLVYLDTPARHGFERVRIFETTANEDKSHDVAVKLSNGQTKTFKTQTLSDVPLVNNMICVEVMRGRLSRRLKLNSASMRNCPLVSELLPQPSTPRGFTTGGRNKTYRSIGTGSVLNSESHLPQTGGSLYHTR